MSDDEPIKHQGLFLYDSGEAQEVNVIHSLDEPCEPEGRKNLDDFDTWKDEQDTLCIRRKTGTQSVGYSRGYSKKFDEIDWGN